jgi:methylated-DNA-[protein]-cysteine S-methyltransferase
MDRIVFSTPAGPIGLEGEEGGLTRLYLPGQTVEPVGGETPLLARGKKQLLEYFEGTRRVFTLPLAPRGTPFYREVWRALCTVEYGQVITYGQLARQVGRPRAVRAVGQANHRNPLAILIPCHRVVGAGGRLTGYAGGLALKEFLLKLEGAWPVRPAGPTEETE